MIRLPPGWTLNTEAPCPAIHSVRELNVLAAQDSATTATLLAHIAEVDHRRLYAEAAYRSMFEYCVRELGFPEDMAGKRIRVARAARRFPAILEGIADGRLHLTGVFLLSKHLKRENAADLLAKAEHKTKAEIQLLVVKHFPQADFPTRVRELPPTPVTSDSPLPAPEQVEVQISSGGSSIPAMAAPPETVTVTHVIQQQHPRTMPLSPGRYGLQLTMSAETHEKLQRAKELLGHAIEYGDLAALLDRALNALIEKLEKRRFGTTDRPRPARPSKNLRHIPAGVRRAVKARDGGQCTFVSDSGRRCEERGDLEFDHIQPVAKRGETTVANLRLRCRPHNQLEAERAFGAGFMAAKRESARDARMPSSTTGSPPSIRPH